MSNCVTCPNCPGCRNGVQYCTDPRCYPNCPNCSTPTNNGTTSSNWIIITVILVLLGILLVVAFFIGYQWYKDRQLANEPKKVTVNRHIHNIKPTKIVPVPTAIPSNPTSVILSQPSVLRDTQDFISQDSIPQTSVSKVTTTQMIPNEMNLQTMSSMAEDINMSAFQDFSNSIPAVSADGFAL